MTTKFGEKKHLEEKIGAIFGTCNAILKILIPFCLIWKLIACQGETLNRFIFTVRGQRENEFN